MALHDDGRATAQAPVDAAAQLAPETRLRIAKLDAARELVRKRRSGGGRAELHPRSDRPGDEGGAAEEGGEDDGAWSCGGWGGGAVGLEGGPGWWSEMWG